MLHEVLLALSGHPSPLFPGQSAQNQQDSQYDEKSIPLVTPSEAALLASIGRLSALHQNTRSHARDITSHSVSTICRAVASSIVHTHLARFQKKILEVESQILSRDDVLVGAYDIVPLASVVAEFDDWTRRMQWYWQIVCFIETGNSRERQPASGAALLDHLRLQSQTGFPDIASSAIELCQVAEKAWLKQLSTWLLYGQLPPYGSADFFIAAREPSAATTVQSYVLNNELLPAFVSRKTADSLLFIGQSHHHVKHHVSSPSGSGLGSSSAESSLLSTHLKLLSSLSLPISPSLFSNTISTMRSSLSRNVLQHVLPLHDIETLLQTLRQIFLLQRSNFATSLIQNAQVCLDTRETSLGRMSRNVNDKKILESIVVKEGEVNETLTRTWKTLVALQIDDTHDDLLDFAQEHIRLVMTESPQAQPPISLGSRSEDVLSTSGTLFSDLLFPNKTALTMNIASPLDLFVSASDIAQYSSFASYLLALRRAHMRLSDLWRLSACRRDDRQVRSVETKALAKSRSLAMRKTWATCSAAVFLLSETAAYFEGEVIQHSWEHFFKWSIEGRNEESAGQENGLAEVVLDVESTGQEQPSNSPPHQSSTQARDVRPTHIPHDPETLSAAHRAFLTSLTYALLLTDDQYTKHLRALFSNIDQLVAVFTRLQTIQQNLDLDTEARIESSYAQDEKAVALDLDRSRKRLDSSMKDVVGRLRQIDHDRLGGDFAHLQVHDDNEDAFKPLRCGGVDRLLMKLDFGRSTDDEMIFS